MIKKYHSRKFSAGVTLIELMVAMVISLILIAGSIASYSSISLTLKTSKTLENAQEVLRYSSQVFYRSLKQTSAIPLLDGTDSIIVSQDGGVVACNGQTPIVAYTETYTYASPNLLCDIGNGTEVILTGITNIAYEISGNSVSVTVTPEGLPEKYANGVQIDVALIRVIFEQATAE